MGRTATENVKNFFAGAGLLVGALSPFWVAWLVGGERTALAVFWWFVVAAFAIGVVAAVAHLGAVMRGKRP